MFIQIQLKQSNLTVIYINYIQTEYYRYVWLCNGDVASGLSSFIHEPHPFLFADIVHPTMNDSYIEGIIQSGLNFHDIQRSIQIGSLT
jgi:hypothetical protein